jgi:hypothetical protein
MEGVRVIDFGPICFGVVEIGFRSTITPFFSWRVGAGAAQGAAWGAGLLAALVRVAAICRLVVIWRFTASQLWF